MVGLVDWLSGPLERASSLFARGKTSTSSAASSSGAGDSTTGTTSKKSIRTHRLSSPGPSSYTPGVPPRKTTSSSATLMCKRPSPSPSPSSSSAPGATAAADAASKPNERNVAAEDLISSSSSDYWEATEARDPESISASASVSASSSGSGSSSGSIGSDLSATGPLDLTTAPSSGSSSSNDHQVSATLDIISASTSSDSNDRYMTALDQESASISTSPSSVAAHRGSIYTYQRFVDSASPNELVNQQVDGWLLTAIPILVLLASWLLPLAAFAYLLNAVLPLLPPSSLCSPPSRCCFASLRAAPRLSLTIATASVLTAVWPAAPFVAVCAAAALLLARTFRAVLEIPDGNRWRKEMGVVFAEKGTWQQERGRNRK